MKLTHFLAITAACAVLVVSCGTQNSTEGVAAQLPSKAQTDSVSYLIGINFGYFLKGNGFAEKLGEINMSEIRKGMEDFLNAKGEPNSEEFNANFKINPDTMNVLFNEFIQKRMAYKAAVNLKKGEEFLEKIYKEEGVVKTDSGLAYKILEEGDEVRAAATDTVWCHYTGKLIDETVFDSSNPEGEPVQFILNRVIKGWTEGLQLIGQGGHIILYVPADLAYGEYGNRGIEPNSVLVFDTELTKIGKVPAEPVDQETEE